MSGYRTLYHIGKRPPKPELKFWTNFQWGPDSEWPSPGYTRPWLTERAGPVVFLTPNYKGVALSHTLLGNVYAYRVPEWVIREAGGIHTFDEAAEILIPESLWSHVKFLGKSMDKAPRRVWGKR